MTRTAKAKELEQVWYDYCITNRLIAYGEVPELSDEEVEERCRKQYEKDCEKIRRKYESTDNKPRVLLKGRRA